MKDGRVLPEQAAKELKMDANSFRHALRNGDFPITIGMAFKREGNSNYTYYVYRKPLDELKEKWGL